MHIVHFPSLACLVVLGEQPGFGWGSCASRGGEGGAPRVLLLCRGSCLPAEAAGLEEVLLLHVEGNSGVCLGMLVVP